MLLQRNAELAKVQKKLEEETRKRKKQNHSKGRTTA
jgi:hypothetical protein